MPAARTHAKTYAALPPTLAPRGLSRSSAAAYIGVSESKFDEMVADGRMPRPKRIDRRTIWDKLQVDEAFSRLPDENDANPWDEALA
jgi:predicted DNA-binding transcriptional regulator AlpA